MAHMYDDSDSDYDDDDAIELFESANERNDVDNMASLFAIMTTVEHLEKAYTRNAIEPQPYQARCLQLISQFKLAEKSVLSPSVNSVETFMKMFDMEGKYPLAVDRLLKSGVPATTLHAIADDRDMTVLVQEATEKFITALDSLQLGQRAVDELQPPMSDLMDALTRVPGFNMDQKNNASEKIEQWLSRLNDMRAAEELSEDQIRQMLHDINASYEAFRRFLGSRGKQNAAAR
mmetsp:Transcript_12250/g.15994  ORF Transcript_12250/g.15994 Transcript_12250/m.15994 type:complete len:233 (-) Transcript_12250:55-753(-)|eukprot:CAMPEP_0116061802 /NCGR_PEP_ID=MMETSP0322-20121206/7307_1 /TAXON_ID=163516 /ORGANISM="Leptocylindrus danicus var. apora, Strain B651" /LENGTH=232 /DNA_ID=CAMNT_0003546841 /DNA_START=237 /DNA_END=935 /DNA_ORIENTATION=-